MVLVFPWGQLLLLYDPICIIPMFMSLLCRRLLLVQVRGSFNIGKFTSLLYGLWYECSIFTVFVLIGSMTISQENIAYLLLPCSSILRAGYHVSAGSQLCFDWFYDHTPGKTLLRKWWKSHTKIMQFFLHIFYCLVRAFLGRATMSVQVVNWSHIFPFGYTWGIFSVFGKRLLVWHVVSFRTHL